MDREEANQIVKSLKIMMSMNGERGIPTVRNMLFVGVHKQDMRIVEAVYVRNPGARGEKSQINSMLIRAAAYGFDEGVDWFLNLGANPFYCDSRALMWSAERGHESVVRRLLKCGYSELELEKAARIAEAVGHDGVLRAIIESG